MKKFICPKTKEKTTLKECQVLCDRPCPEMRDTAGDLDDDYSDLDPARHLTKIDLPVKRVVEADVDVAEQCEMAVGELDRRDAYSIASDYLTAFDLDKVFGIITEASMKLAVGRCKKVYQNIRWTKKAVTLLKVELEREA